jgi:hypothetical protein
MARLVGENEYPKDMCYVETGLCVAHRYTIPGTMINKFLSFKRIYIQVILSYRVKSYFNYVGVVLSISLTP